MDVKQAIQSYEEILIKKMIGGQEQKAFTEIMMVLLVGTLWGLYNPHQIAQQLQISPKQFYQSLKAMSPEGWRGLLNRMMMESAIKELKKYMAGSAATKSRLNASISVDDSVVKRLGKALSYVWVWYSGQAKKVVTGQDLLGIVVCIGKAIIPLRLVWVSKQGRGSTTKPAILLRELAQLKQEFAKEGIDLTQLGISFDSWWVNQPALSAVAQLGFTKQVVAGKSSLMLDILDVEGSLKEHNEEFKFDLKSGWGHKTPAKRVIGDNPTFGIIGVIFFYHPRSKVFTLLLPSKPLRTCEALRIWVNQHGVETFWKRLKQWLGLGKMQMQQCAGAWAEITLRVLAYFLASSLFNKEASTLAQLTHWLRRQGTFADLINKLFQAQLLL